MDRTKCLIDSYKGTMLFFLLLTLAYPTILTVSADSVVSISPSSRAISPGQDIDIYIYIEPETPIAGAQLDLLFDSSKLSVINVEDEGFFEQNGAMSIFIGGTVDNTQGRINGLFAVTLGKAEISSAGTFAHITFTAGNDTGSCTIDLSNVILSDSTGKAVPVTVRNAQVNIPEISPSLTPETMVSPGGGGGGGGAGDTGENVANVDLKEVSKNYVTGGTEVTYLFEERTNPILSISYLSIKNAGFITSTIEVLKDVSSTVSERPEGLIYRNVNIWVGKAGYATGNNIEDTRISFTVLKKWMLVNGVGTGNIHLQRYHEGKWDTLDTDMTGENEDFYIFEAKTPGFSPFAITADVPGTAMEKVLPANENTSDIMVLADESEQADKTRACNEAQRSAKLAQNSSLMLCISILAVLLCRRRQMI